MALLALDCWLALQAALVALPALVALQAALLAFQVVAALPALLMLVVLPALLALPRPACGCRPLSFCQGSCSNVNTVLTHVGLTLKSARC